MHTRPCARCGATLTVDGWPQNRLTYCAPCKREHDRDRQRERLAARGHAVTQVTVAPARPPDWTAY